MAEQWRISGRNWCTPGAGELERVDALKSSLADARTAAAIGGDVVQTAPSSRSAPSAAVAELAAAE